MKNLEEKEIKQFSEFTEVTPESSQNLITDRGRFTVGALFNAVVGYAADLINAAVQAAQSAASQYAQDAQTSAAQASVSAEAAESAKTQSQGYAEEAETIVSDGLEAVQAARDSALQDIEVYTDPDGRISNLEKTASKVGRFYANGGKASGSVPNMGSLPFSFAFCMARKTPLDTLKAIFDKSLGWGADTNGFTVLNKSNGRFGFYLRTARNIAYSPYVEIQDSSILYDGKLHSIIFIASQVSSSEWKIFIDGLEVLTSSGSGTEGSFTGDFSNTYNLKINDGANTDLVLARVFAANYDMSASDAPYSVADYAAGKLPPPSICDTSSEKRALLALDDYCIEVGSTKYIPDVSGGANDFTVTGDFKGDKDISIKRLAALISQSNA